MSVSVNRSMSFTDKVRAHLEILDPVTWISVFPCLAGGVMASGAMQPTLHDYFLLLAIFLMFGPLGTGFSQSINDYYDLELDKVNEPTRPIPSGRMTEKEAVWNSVVVCLLALCLGVFLGFYIGGERGLIITSSIVAGLIVAYIYSAPPLKLKKNILTSAPAVGFSYSLVTWFSANALFSEIRPEVYWLAGLNFFMAMALIIMNDFKSAKGDKEGGMKSLTVMIGMKNTFLVSFIMIDLVFLVFAWLEYQWGFYYLVVLMLGGLILNIYMQVKLYADPKGGVAFMGSAVDDVFGNTIGQSEVEEHKAYLRFQIANNVLFLSNNLFAAGAIGMKYMQG
ncbi:MAG: UbiA family prenyltransferase [Chlorobium phaeobacteroides]|uniref:Bacteriochlorophyll/chlorophyll synthetase n=1 Tax=Chlorobium phaeobacteroides (strain BS1) TaxID=331678 RepID=B3ENP2_CHLPB|nr:UbiA family prenyltransferase [Chlorobium phaeobacteroides]MBL6955659.1 UbiA family prenyltransferase [Chlorobium phaeobacteroides]